MLRQKTRARPKVVNKLSPWLSQFKKKESRLKNIPMPRTTKCQIKMLIKLATMPIKKMLVSQYRSRFQHQIKEETMSMPNHWQELFHDIMPPPRTVKRHKMGGEVLTSSRPHG